ATTPMPNPPSAEQVGKWAGFPESFKLNMASKPVTNTEAVFGHPAWVCRYENAKQSLTSFTIMFFEPGKLFGAKRTVWIKLVEETVARKRMNGASESLLENPFQIVVLPNGRKVYFTMLGITHGGGTLMGFCYERNYDLLVLEDFAEDDRLPEKRMQQPVTATNDLHVVFAKVKTFLDAQ
ncbi:MAG: hypothetical protein QOD03_282, partial [Verrucomicrobiota bacterium]